MAPELSVRRGDAASKSTADAAIAFPELTSGVRVGYFTWSEYRSTPPGSVSVSWGEFDATRPDPKPRGLVISAGSRFQPSSDWAQILPSIKFLVLHSEWNSWTIDLLKKLKNLKAMRFDLSPSSAAMIDRLPLLPNVTELWAIGSDNVATVDAGSQLERFLERCPGTRSIDVSEFDATRFGLNWLGANPNIEELILYHCAVSMHELTSVREHPGIRKLRYVVKGELEPAGFAQLLSFSNLIGLDLQMESLAASDWEHVGERSNLRRLRVSNAEFEERKTRLRELLPSLRTLEAPASLWEGRVLLPRELRRLDVRNSGFGDPQCAILPDCRTLEELVLRDSLVTGEGVVRLATLQGLRSLDLSGCVLTGFRAEALPRSIESLDVSRTKFDDRDLRAVLGRLLNLKSLNVGGAKVSGAALIAAISHPRLSRLVVRGTLLTPDQIRQLSMKFELHHDR